MYSYTHGQGGLLDRGERGESIYQIIPPKPVSSIKLPMHRSRHDGQTPPTASTFHTLGTTRPLVSNVDGGRDEGPLGGSLSARTMGSAPGTARNCPESYLRSRARTARVPTLSDVKRTNPDLLRPTSLSARLKPPVPSRDDTPIHNLVTSKNFVVANAVEAILSTPRTVTTGAKDYLLKEDYGKAPRYLAQIKQDIQDEFEYIRELQQQQDDARGSRIAPLEELERLQLIEGLKAKWEQVNTCYQAATHLTTLDTVGKRRRKERWESELQQIEKDIGRLNRTNLLVDAAY